MANFCFVLYKIIKMFGSCIMILVGVFFMVKV